MYLIYCFEPLFWGGDCIKYSGKRGVLGAGRFLRFNPERLEKLGLPGFKQQGLQDKVEITGWASNALVQQQILAGRAMVLPSFAEGLLVVAIEALALGRPVISTYVAGIPELLEPGVCGWLVRAGSVEVLTAVMSLALKSLTEYNQN